QEEAPPRLEPVHTPAADLVDDRPVVRLRVEGEDGELETVLASLPAVTDCLCAAGLAENGQDVVRKAERRPDRVPARQDGHARDLPERADLDHRGAVSGDADDASGRDARDLRIAAPVG